MRNPEIEDPDLLSLFAVAEERFQRTFRVGDLIDLAALVPALVTTYGDGLVDAVTTWAAKLCLASELLQLSLMVAEWWTLPQEWGLVLEKLTELATAESAARRAGGQVLHTACYGVALDTVSSATELHLTVQTMPDCELATTPVGTFLLVESAAIDEDTHQHGLAAARNLHRRNGTHLT